MPHIVIKLVPGRSAEQLDRLTQAILRDVTLVLECEEELVSIGIEEVSPESWMADVYAPKIAGKAHTLTKQPGYSPQG